MSDQGGKCWICQGDNGLKALCIDHDHKTNNVRGLLCNLCNRAIGLLQDDPELIDKAAAYIRKGSPDHLQGKLIGRHGKKVRVPLDHIEPQYDVEKGFRDLVEVIHRSYPQGTN